MTLPVKQGCWASTSHWWLASYKLCLHHRQALCWFRACPLSSLLILAIICPQKLEGILEILRFRFCVWKMRKLACLGDLPWPLAASWWQSQARNPASSVQTRTRSCSLPAHVSPLGFSCYQGSLVIILMCDYFIFLKLIIHSNSLDQNLHLSKTYNFFFNGTGVIQNPRLYHRSFSLNNHLWCEASCFPFVK